MEMCPFLEKADCCASKWLCKGAVPTRRASNVPFCQRDWRDCAVYKRAERLTVEALGDE